MTGQVDITAAITERRYLLRILWLSAMGVVIVGSVLPASDPALRLLARFRVSDKLLHFTAYLVLALLPALHESRRALAAVSALLCAMSVSLEFVQLDVAGRAFEAADAIAGVTGVLAGLISGWGLRVKVR